MVATKLEVWVQLVIVFSTAWFMLHAQAFGHPYISWLEGGYGADFHGYMELARGNAPGHAYKQWVGYLFKPFLLLNETQAMFMFMSLSLVSYMVLAHYVMKVKYGWILSLACLKPLWFSMVSGNISPILCLPLVSFNLAWMAVLIKPHLIMLVGCVAFLVRPARNGQ